MAENFNLIFGSQAPATATWSDADYQTGWSTVGSTPPTAEQFDFLQNRADLKAKELNDTLTPLVQKSEADGRQAGTIYASGACVTVDGLPNGWLLECVVAGTSGTVAITLPDPLIDGLTITDGTVTWKLRKVATNGGLGYRQPSTAYTAGQIAYHSALPTGYYLECTTAGISGSGALTISGTTTIGTTVSDGTAVWTICKSLSVSGGDFINTSGTNGTVFERKDDIGNVVIRGGAGYGHGAGVYVYGKDHSSRPGFFSLLAYTGATENELIGKPDGTLTWNSNDLAGSAIVAKSLGTNGYIKYASGLIVQWGEWSTTNGASQTINFPISFSTKVCFATADVFDNGVPSQNNPYCVVYASLTKITIHHNYNTGFGDSKWFAIGY